MAKKVTKTNSFDELKKKVITLIGQEWEKFNNVQWKEFEKEINENINSIPQHENTEILLKGILGFKIWLDENYSNEDPSTFGRHFLNNVVHDIEGVENYKKDWYSPRCGAYSELYDKSLQSTTEKKK